MRCFAAVILFCAATARAEPTLPPSLWGADSLGRGTLVAGVGGGVALLAPSFGLDLAVGVSSRVDLLFHYDTYLGVVHAFDYEARVRLARAGSWTLAARAQVGYAFWILSRALDFATEDLPLGNGLSSLVGVRASRRVGESARLTLELAAAVQIVSLVRIAEDAHEARADVGLRAIVPSIHAEWPTSPGRAVFLRVGAWVPVRGIVPLGYVPVIELGWSASL